jgi:hypothetical protein
MRKIGAGADAGLDLLTLIPGQSPYVFAPSPQASILMAKVFDSPKKDIYPAYATHFLNYKGIVSTEYLTNFIESDATVEIVHDAALGLDFLHFAVSPKKVSIDYYQPKDQYYCNFKLSVSLRRGDTVVFQYSRDYPFYFPPDRVETIQANGIAVQDLFPSPRGVPPDRPPQNAVGKGSRFSRRTSVSRPPMARSRLDPSSDTAQDAAGAWGPFKVLRRQI